MYGVELPFMIKQQSKFSPPSTGLLYSGNLSPPIIENMFKDAFNIKIPTQINQPTGAMIIYNKSGHKIKKRKLS